MPVQTIAPADLQKMRDQGNTPEIIDVRTPAEYLLAHIQGAKLVPLDSLDPAAIAAERRGTTQPIYVVCEKGGRAAKACQRLIDAGVSPVLSIEGGTAAWISAGLPVERKNVRVISLERQVRIVAGTLVLIGSLLALFVHIALLAIPIFIGSGLIFAGVTDFCGMGMLLARMPWNQKVACKP